MVANGGDVSATVATWLSLAVTTIGLTGIVSQAAAINNRMDPFHANRNREYLGVWVLRQKHFPWWAIAKSPPVGPIIKANLDQGFCGMQLLHLTRIPLTLSGKASWAAFLSVVHVKPPHVRRAASEPEAEKGTIEQVENVDDGASYSESESGHSCTAQTADFQINGQFAADPTEWHSLSQCQLVRHQNHACILISRTTLITMMLITNARKVFQHSDASGFRAGYASYSGQWYITWPIGSEAIARFAPHDSHNQVTDVYPPSFIRRVDRCVQMCAGVVAAPRSGLQVAFTGRKPHGTYTLLNRVKGFPGAHGSRHLYNMMGGRVYEVDFLFASKQEEDAPPPSAEELVLHLPSTMSEAVVYMIIPPATEQILCHALDCLPWSTLSWSCHRGLRDVLVAYSRPVMNAHRQELADMLSHFVESNPGALDKRGWNPVFVRTSMGDMAASAMLAEEGNSGDLVRVVTSIVLAMIGDEVWDFARLDVVWFWRRLLSKRHTKMGATLQVDGQDSHIPPTPATASLRSLDSETVVALTKTWILEWSQDFDYQMYHEMSTELRFL